ncbi:hypothetical protein P8918_13675 [Bacillus spizizenii]|nr:hypothetical protein [Bacillus spizizenii]MCY8890354.1 hypothetical protein [Bacillus spizizenii]MEC0842078.1 hypothetical protein [Bacillus spizizenii]
MLRNAKEVKAKNVVEMETSKGESFLYVCAPITGKRYRFYYKRLLKFIAKWSAISTGLVVGGYLMINTLFNAWDSEYENRMQQQEEHLQSIEENKFEHAEPISNDEFNLLYNQGGKK